LGLLPINASGPCRDPRTPSASTRLTPPVISLLSPELGRVLAINRPARRSVALPIAVPLGAKEDRKPVMPSSVPRATQADRADSPSVPPFPVIRAPRWLTAGYRRAIFLVALGVAAPVPGFVMGEPAALTSDAGPSGNALRGAELWRGECASCHQVGPGATNGVGPNLNHLFGRRAASVEDYEYSPPFRRAGANGLRWDFGTLDAYIEEPAAVVSGNRMSYPGLGNAEARADLLAHIRVYSDSPRATPKAAAATSQVEVDLPDGILDIEGDREWGEYLATECTTCHQRGGTDEGIPSITNWPEEQFIAAMHAYRVGLRQHEVMQMTARRLSDEDIVSLASYFATIDE
jgi:cytochrome c